MTLEICCSPLLPSFRGARGPCGARPCPPLHSGGDGDCPLLPARMGPLVHPLYQQGDDSRAGGSVELPCRRSRVPCTAGRPVGVGQCRGLRPGPEPVQRPGK